MEKGTVMRSYASGEELIAEIRKRADLFIVAPWTERKMADVGVTAQD